MPEQELLELLQRDSDGATTPAEQELLRERLEHDSDARQARDELQSVVETLESMPPDEPPADFAAAVMAAVRDRAGAPVVHARFGAKNRKWLWFRVAAGVAAAAVLVILLAPPFLHVVDVSRLRGTMFPHAPQKQWSVHVAPAITATVIASRTSVSLTLPANAPNRSVNVAFSPADLRLRPTADVHVVSNGVVRVALGAAPRELFFDRLSERPSELIVALQGDRAQQQKTSIHIPPGANF